MTTFHVGDCSTGCNRCAVQCARDGHKDCIGTDGEKAIGDWLVWLKFGELATP